MELPAAPPGQVASLLYARLQVSTPDARSILLAWTTSSDVPSSRRGASPLAPSLAEAYRSAGIDAKLLPLPSDMDRLLMLDELTRILAGNRLTVVEGSGLLDSPNTIIAVRAVDTVVVLARRGRSRRSDLEAARRELSRGGATVAGAVLID